MKRIAFIIAALLCTMGKAVADEVVVDNITIPQGGQARLNVCSSITSGNVYTGFQLDISLPDGVTTEKNETDVPIVTKGALLSDHVITPSVVSSGDDRLVVVSFSKTPFAGNEGVLLSVTLNADASLSVGDKLTATIKNITFTTTDVENTPFNDITFTITIGEPVDDHLVLDELSTTEPVAAAGVDVRMKRTIKGGEWSTIALPFAMSGEQVKAAFGNDVQLADFDGIETTTDADENITDITVKFNDIDVADGMEANHPYLIKVSSDIAEFTAEGVDIVPEEEVSVDKDEYTVGTGKKKVTYYNSMVGTYVANTVVPNLALFIYDNHFYYSTGQTRMKGFRAYFDFYDVMTEVEDSYATIKMRIDVGEEVTEIRLTRTGEPAARTSVYDINGRQLNAMQHGLNIVNGTKIYNK